MKKMINICFVALAMLGCNSQAKQEAAIMQAKQAVIDSIVKVDYDKKIEDIRKHISDSISQVAVTKQQHNEVLYRKSSDGTNTATTTTTKVTKQKKGWSNKAKGAVIGAGVGAVTGAMIDKKKGEGAVIGGIIGAGAGLGVGAIIDDKEKKQSKQ
jgi:chromatin remodeling complex protein RSC6